MSEIQILVQKRVGFGSFFLVVDVEFLGRINVEGVEMGNINNNENRNEGMY